MIRLRQALAVGLVLGGAWGAVEALLILVLPALALEGSAGVSLLDGADMLAVASLGALRYAVAGAVVTVLLTLALGPFLGRSPRAADMLPVRVLVAFAVAVNFYWWTKPLWQSSWGYPFHHPVRLAQTAGWFLLGGVAAWAVTRPRVVGDPGDVPSSGNGLRRLALFGVTLLGLGWWATGAADWGVSSTGLDAMALLPCLAGALAVALVLGDPDLRLRRPGPAVTVGALLVLAGCGGWAQMRETRLLAPPPAPARTGDRPPNVLLIVADALRADHLGAYGHERDPAVSPRLDAMAQQGVVLEQAWVQAPFTWTSFGSLLTAKYPRRHGLIKMSPTQRLDPQENRTLGEALREHGYATGAFLTGTLSNQSGLLKGFDTYFETIVGHEPVNRSSKWSIVRSRMLLAILFNKIRGALDPELVNTEALRWIDARGDEPFFAMVHYYSTHTPYDPPAPYDALYGLPEYAGPYHPFTQSHAVLIMKAMHSGRCWVPDCVAPLWTCGHFDPERDVPAIHALYDGGVRFLDKMVGDLLDLLEARGIADDTLVVFTSDHGEELFDHALFEHDWMFETNLHVPVILRFPGRLPAGARVPWPNEVIDLAPTILELTGRGTLPDGDGRSLLPDIAGSAPPDDELWVFAENVRYVSMRGPRYKLTRNRYSQACRVFDLQTDPHEMRPLDPSDPAHAAVMRDLLARLDAYEAGMPEVTSLKTFASDPELSGRLAAMGYVSYLNEGEPADGGGAHAQDVLEDALMLGSNEMMEEDLYRRAFRWTPEDQARVLGKRP